MNRRPLVWFAVFWIAGSSLAAELSMGGVAIAICAGALMLLALVLLRKSTWRLAAVCLIGCTLAAAERDWADARNVTALELHGASYEAEVTGTIMSAALVDGDRATFRVTADTVRLGGEAAPRKVRERLLVQVRLAEQPHQEIAAAWHRGDKVRLAGELTLPAGASNSGGFDYRRYLYSSQHIHWLLKVKGIGAVHAAPGPGWTAAAMLGRVDAARDWLGARVDQLYPADQSGYMKGLVLGIREDLDPDQFQQFSRLGLTHILAISGLHVAVFIYALGAVLRLLRMTRERMLVTLIAAVPFYVLLSGSSPSVVRAGLMTMLALLASRMDKLKDGLHLLAAAAVAMLVWNPYFIQDVGFQLSFAVTAGLILFVPPVRRAMPDWPKGKALLDLLVVTVVAQAVSFPLTIYYFNQFHLLSIPANLILVPFISFIVMPIGAVALLFGLLWPLGGQLLAAVSVYANDWTFLLVSWLGEADAVRTIWATPPLWWIAAWYLALAGLCRTLPAAPAAVVRANANADDTQPLPDRLEPDTAPIWELQEMQKKPLWRKRSTGMVLMLAAGAGLLLYAYFPDLYNRTAEVDVLDVGQGDSIYIRTPEGKRILVDGGGTLSFRKAGDEWKERSDPFEVGGKVVVPLLMKRGVHELDLLVISHLDSDHIRGLQAVLDSIPVKAILWNGSLKHAEDAEAILRAAVQKRVPLYRAEFGKRWRMDANTELTVLWPPEADGRAIPDVDEQNDDSVVLYMKIYHSAFLLSGDISSVAESSILSRLQSSGEAADPPSIHPVDVLKVGHHGSKYSTSEEWLRYWQPLRAAISVGATNTYGHPHPDVLKRLEAASAAALRTDRDGEIRYKVNPTGIYEQIIRKN
ncbi:DNA internalization-related competence protein ComEC/Rec2 [Paenibacillus glycanilyticus]|uniref:DNA internalization-related competence protein ComEC/Rec2 n=1 Tax=Paenibacillus glycanilyticus TaxID=126569 RepID=UPI00203BD74D|nr:DNA internalization-related competence protein ComEC/Rec2 [Paenibacillus glycanilyticus]MCM3627240.1 DNA internalization-related competence protein ComEC/Rec2 [Paenibacillus glycanilyticus]